MPNPLLIYDQEKVHPYYICEELLNDIKILSNVLLLDNVDTPYKTWNPYSRLNEKIVNSFYEREQRTLKYDVLIDWEMDDEHGIVHSFFTAFWATYILNKHYKRDMEQLYHTIDQDFIDIFYSCLTHDFYRFFKDEKHDINLKKLFPNCVEQTYRHEKPNKEDTFHPLIIADRIELFRLKDFEVDESVFDDILTKQELNIIKFFYKNFRGKFDYAWLNRNEPLLTHYVENFEEWDFNSKIFPSKIDSSMPKNTCSVFVRPNMYLLEEGNNRYFMYGVLPIKYAESLPMVFKNEHPALKHDMMNDNKDWLFLYTISNEFQHNMVEKGIYPIKYDILFNFLYLTDQIFSNFVLNTIYEAVEN